MSDPPEWEVAMPRALHIVTLISLVAALMIIAGVSGTPVVSSVGAAQQEDAAQIRDLAERLLTYPYGTSTGESARAQLLVGRLPAEFPFPLPLPQGARLVGSAVRMAGSDVMGVEVAIEAPGTPAQILGFYDTALPAAGLSLAPSSYRGGGGFQPGAAKRSDTFCLGETGPWLSLSAAEQPGGALPDRRSDVRVSVTMRAVSMTAAPIAYAGPCAPPEARGYSYGSGSAAGRLLPRLSGPPDVPLQSTGGMQMTGQEFATSSALAVTDMSVAAFEAFFAEQLRSAGWMRRAGAEEGPVAWSLWALPEEGEWQGVLTVMEAPGEQRRRLSLLVESAAAGTAIPGPSPFYYGP
jgi:hypothetical protein